MDLTRSVIERVMAEANILSMLRNNINIVEIYGVSVLPPSICIILELCYYGSLSDIIHQKSSKGRLSLTLKDKMLLVLGCCRGVSALHSLSKSMCHHDIKSFNFLVDFDLNTKLCDLELGSSNDELAVDSGEMLVNWMPPEILQNGIYTQSSDIYALTLVIWEIFSGEVPYNSQNKAFQDVGKIKKMVQSACLQLLLCFSLLWLNIYFLYITLDYAWRKTFN
jgi:serine/threonine protein kinase